MIENLVLKPLQLIVKYIRGSLKYILKAKKEVNNKTKQDILTAFEIYKDIVFEVDADLRFWQSFLKFSIDEYKNKNSRPDDAFSAIFIAYNVNPNSTSDLLKTYEKFHTLKTLDLDKHSLDFFNWVTNLSILKMYNALEIFLLQAIRLRFFPDHKNPIVSKKAVEQINKEIKSFLTSQNIGIDTKNNRHIIHFLKQNSTEITSFLKLPIRNDLTTSWENFFELVSILRHVIAHQGTILSTETHNEIKSKARDVFQQHFINKDNNNYMKLQPNVVNFSNFNLFCNTFVVNVVKLMYNQNDLKMFNMI